MNDKHRAILRRHGPKLRRDLEPKKLLPYLSQVLDSVDEEYVKAGVTRIYMADRLLEMLPRKGPATFDEFVKALQRIQPFLADLLLQESAVISEAVDRLMALSFTSQSILTVDEVKQVQRKRVDSIIGHIFQPTYAALCDPLIHEENVHRCNGCAIDHPSQRQHSCIMMDTEDSWNYYHDEAERK
ncbi:hypothetical protein OS493_022002 [Desmophyllum pertusum]|uniref:CARD domain-containing protein n=1 Tax=Desmophyllum pertusum TaxID=174260 RepID=A0A9W9YYW1_9CNID|nr:hypothetical protein OS493_022002 [Desmophyllum pertusum]